MNYVISDVHGMYDKYMKMLEIIDLSDSDMLYILGDVIDRGDKPIEILLDMMKRNNVVPIIGNHELMAINVFEMMFENMDDNGTYTIPKEKKKKFDNYLMLWALNKCGSTLDGMKEMNIAQKREIFDYLKNFHLYKSLDINERKFILVHAGFENFSKEKNLSDYSADELVWCRHTPDERYYSDENIYVVTGHTPTVKFNGRGGIIRKNGNIMIDCGAENAKNGKLGCLCLDNMEEYYA